jgi:hypothetical protein
VSVSNVLVRQLLKIRIFENFVQRPDEIVISGIALSAVGLNDARNLGTEIVIIITQAIERLGIFVVADRPQRSRKAPKKFAFCGVC